MNVRAKFRCTSNEPYSEECRSIRLDAAYDPDPNGPNASWSKWTPSGQILMSITNPAAFNQFEVGKEYYLDFTPAE